MKNKYYQLNMVLSVVCEKPLREFSASPVLEWCGVEGSGSVIFVKLWPQNKILFRTAAECFHPTANSSSLLSQFESTLCDWALLARLWRWADS